MYPFIKHLWTGSRANCWDLHSLAVEGKERFYQRCGFVDVVGRATDGVGNPLAGRVRGGAILFRDPEDEDRERVIEVSGGDGDL